MISRESEGAKSKGAGSRGGATGRRLAAEKSDVGAEAGLLAFDELGRARLVEGTATCLLESTSSAEDGLESGLAGGK